MEISKQDDQNNEKYINNIYDIFDDDEKFDDDNDDDIAGFSSNEDDDNTDVLKSAVRTYPFSAKRASGNRKTVTRKRCKKQDEDYSSPLARPFRKSNTRRKSITNTKKWSFSNDFQNSFTEELERKESRNDAKVDIIWSDSDSEDRKCFQTESPDFVSQAKIPLSTQCVEEIETQLSGNIGEFDSDDDEAVEQLKDSSPSITPNTPSPTPPTPCSPEKAGASRPSKESTPSISPNTPTPTPTPTPCSPEKKGEIRPPLDSSKKKTQQYLRGGLAERLQQLTVKKTSQTSFWFHKTQQRNRENDDGFPSTAGETLTVRVTSESLDYGAHVIRCHVISQDGAASFQTKQHVTVVLDGEMRNNLDSNLTSKFLKIYSPWRILDPPGFSTAVLVCLTYCEIISPPSFVSEDSSESPEVEQHLTEELVDLEHGKDQDEERKEPENEIGDEQTRASSETVVDWNPLKYQGLCMASSVNVTARVQRIFWREVETRNQSLNSASSLIHSIIENLKIIERNKTMSLCCLVQSPLGVCCEVRFPQDILLNTTNWLEMLCQSEGTILSFSRLRLLEQRNRKRSSQLFGLIDSLKNRKNLQNERSKKQQTCCIFLADEHCSLEPVSEGKVSDFPSYVSPENLNDLNSASVRNSGRARVCGELLHVRFTKDSYYDTKHIHLWLSGKSVAQDCAITDVMAEPTVSVVHVRYSSGRTVEWNEFTLLPGQLLSIQDLVLDKATPAVHTADIFSKIQIISSHSSRPQHDGPPRDIHEVWHRTMTIIMTDKEYGCLKSLPAAALPVLSEDCMVDSLVMFEGVIFDVDQENAFSWYTCSHCNGEDISEIQDALSSLRYRCNLCSQLFASPVTNTRLEVYLRSTTRLKAKVKLLQQTISRLLSRSGQGNDESYNVECVLDKHLGPLYCCIVEKIQDKNSKISFKLEELDSSSWIK